MLLSSRVGSSPLALFIFSLALALSFAPIAEAAWALSWSDEFNRNTLNTSNWDICTYAPGTVNDELEGYTAEDVLVAKGVLVLRQQRRHYTSPQGWTANFTSGRIDCARSNFIGFMFPVTHRVNQALSKRVQLYGRVEVRAKIPKGNGLWPAIWMLPGRAYNLCWPSGGEIDITEVLGQNTFQSYQTYHYNEPELCGQNDQFGNNVTWPIDLSEDFHVYAIEWNATLIAWYLDGELINVMKDGVRGINGHMMRVPSSPMGVILNVAIGGNWPVPPDKTTPFPTAMFVDYVRVYHRV